MQKIPNRKFCVNEFPPKEQLRKRFENYFLEIYKNEQLRLITFKLVEKLTFNRGQICAAESVAIKLFISTNDGCPLMTAMKRAF